jgi:hypothetical protein
MTTLIEKIIDDALDRSDITDPIGEMLEYVADRILEEVLNILNNEQGSMNVRADHARHLAKEIKWKLTTDFDHFTTEFKTYSR